MLSDIGFNDNLEVAGRKFHFQTVTQSNKGKIRTEIFENGRILSASEIDFERRRSSQMQAMEERLRTMVESLHQEMIEEVELLFRISEKVNKLRHSPSNCKVGQLFLHHNLIEDAVRQFKIALENDPKNAEAYSMLGQTYIHTGDYQKAVDILAKGIRLDSRFTDMHNNYGLALMMSEVYDQAIEEFKQAIKLNRDYLEAHYNLAMLYYRTTSTHYLDKKIPPPSIRIQRAGEHLNYIKDAKIKVFESVYTKIQKLAENHQFDAVVKLLEENRKKVFPGDFSRLISNTFYLKFMYGGKGLDNDTIKRYENRLNISLEQNPDYADIWNNLGVIHLIQCRNLFLQALSEFNRALELNPGFEKAIKNKKLVENDGKEFLILLRAILR